MALTITGVPDCRANLGPSQSDRAYQLQPALSDYVTSGYPINATQVDLYNLYGAWVIAENAAATAYDACFVQAAFPANPVGQTQLKMLVTVKATGAQVANGADLSACAWIVEFRGF